MRLTDIKSPQDLYGRSPEELLPVAEDLRAQIIETVACNGGHLAPNLGVVELTLALHSVLRSPQDKIIWDVGHQCYAHKILTGRGDRFSTLRTTGGISGFPRRQESVHDAFNTGHSSTSISAALGMAMARDCRGENHQVVAVIGDGSMTGGLAFEGLNHAGHLGLKLTVILNDNEMSIAPNVGALSGYLNRLRMDPTFSRVRADIEYLLRRLPAIGGTVAKAVERVKASLKYLMVPGIFFEELGFTYLGPIDGHQIGAVQRALTDAALAKGPVLIHVVTQKGRGYLPAEKNPSRYHGVGPLNAATGEAKSKPGMKTYTEVFGETLVRLADRDKRVVAITAAMPAGTGLTTFAAKYPQRFHDVAIAEQHAVTFAAGLAAAGMRPFFAVYSTFLQRAFDQVIHDVCLQNLPVTLAIDRAGLVGEDGPTHHGVYDISFLRQIPNMVIMAPKDEAELASMLVTAHTYSGPAAIRYPRGPGLGVPVPEDPQPLRIGKSEILREGKDLLILAVGRMVSSSLQAARILAQGGIEATVVNVRFVKPLDKELLMGLMDQIPRVLTVEENAVIGGFGSAVLELIAATNLSHVQVQVMGIPDEFIEHGNTSDLQKQLDLTPAGIARWGKRLIPGVKLMREVDHR